MIEIDGVAASLVALLVDSLRQHEPRHAKCTFLNCEIHQTEGGVTISGDLFAVTQFLLGKPRRSQRTLNLHEVKLLNELGKVLMELHGTSHVTLDLIVTGGSVKEFVGLDPLHRIGGNDDFFKSKHRSYVHLEPWLGRID